MDDKSYNELVNECSRDLCLDSDKCTADCHKVNCETSWHATKLLRAGWVKQKKGRWLFSDYGGIHYYQCSCCDYELEIPLTYTKNDVIKYKKYCTNCGAYMIEE